MVLSIQMWINTYPIIRLSDPRFISAHLIPESDNPEDDKVYFFFRENAIDGEHTGKATHARIGQICKVRYRKTNWGRYCSITMLFLISFNVQMQWKIWLKYLNYHYKYLKGKKWLKTYHCLWVTLHSQTSKQRLWGIASKLY